MDGRKKARCTCDGSTRSSQVRVLDEMYANCIDQTSACLFYAVAAAENLIVYGADVYNAFAEAPPPKQGFFIWPDNAFHSWWTDHLMRPPIPQGHVIPIFSAMQACGKKMTMPSCGILALPRRYMNPVCTLVQSTITG